MVALIGAHSYFQDYRYHNTYDMGEYIASSSQLNRIQKNKEPVNLKAQMEEYMFLGLRLTDGISIEGFEERFNSSLWDVYGDQLSNHIKQKLIAEKGGRIFLTPFGQDVSNIVFSSFL